MTVYMPCCNGVVDIRVETVGFVLLFTYHYSNVMSLQNVLFSYTSIYMYMYMLCGTCTCCVVRVHVVSYMYMLCRTCTCCVVHAHVVWYVYMLCRTCTCCVIHAHVYLLYMDI